MILDPGKRQSVYFIFSSRVEVIPRFERELTDLLSYDGDAVEFECHVTGNPEPDIRWFHYNEVSSTLTHCNKAQVC